jgi:hypothetical protein
LKTLIVILFISANAIGQTISTNIPVEINKAGKYLFYLHGGVVTVFGQIDTLFRAGVRPENLLLLGASAGSHIVMHVSSRLKNKQIRYVIMGGCWPETYKDYLGIELYGKFLSIVETTDPHGTCYKIFEGRKHLSSHNEIKLNTGLSHGFIYKGHKEWIDPIVRWFEGSN